MARIICGLLLLFLLIPNKILSNPKKPEEKPQKVYGVPLLASQPNFLRPFPQKRMVEFCPQLVLASWYGKQFHGRKMANGKRFNMYDYRYVAHPTFPLGTKILIINPKNGKHINVAVGDRGPWIKGRGIDLSMAGAKKLGFYKEGLTELIIKVLPNNRAS